MALVDAVAAVVAAERGGKAPRRACDRDGLHRALGAIVGGVLRRWLRDSPAFCTRTATPGAFTGSQVGYRQFRAATAALFNAGLIARVPGGGYQEDFGELGKSPKGRPGVYWPTPAAAD